MSIIQKVAANHIAGLNSSLEEVRDILGNPKMRVDDQIPLLFRIWKGSGYDVFLGEYIQDHLTEIMGNQYFKVWQTHFGRGWVVNMWRGDKLRRVLERFADRVGMDLSIPRGGAQIFLSPGYSKPRVKGREVLNFNIDLINYHWRLRTHFTDGGKESIAIPLFLSHLSWDENVKRMWSSLNLLLTDIEKSLL